MCSLRFFPQVIGETCQQPFPRLPGICTIVAWQERKEADRQVGHLLPNLHTAHARSSRMVKPDGRALYPCCLCTPRLIVSTAGVTAWLPHPKTCDTGNAV
ncbi:MAG: hypothetical protein KatS3mg056_1341 [Chloroflexus sp.]|nr:MAG: hypothetical protein KatS3mg056_1341 [Chloroflexus sp.]